PPLCFSDPPPPRDPHSFPTRRSSDLAVAIGVLGEEGSIWLPKLLADRDTGVVMAACRSAGVLRNRACVESIIRRLADPRVRAVGSEEHTSELQSRFDLVCRLLLEKKK